MRMEKRRAGLEEPSVRADLMAAGGAVERK